MTKAKIQVKAKVKSRKGEESKGGAEFPVAMCDCQNTRPGW